EDTDVSKDDLVERFGGDVAALVEGVTKIDDMDVGKSTRKAASLRKMVWAMVEDLRVVFIKLADKRHNMSTLQYILEDERRLRIARECLEIYAPMAGKLGMSSLKTELEDLSFKYLKPDIYTQISEHVALKNEERKQYLDKIQGDLLRAAAKSRLKIQVDTRAKHFYSIYRKMKDRGKDLEEIYDLLGVRIICESTVACYTLLGVVHGIWVPFEGRFKDYIARPKGNGYRSLHTSVLTEGGRQLEIQIRSRTMHETAEYGIAAHWAYKEGKIPDQIHPGQVAMVKQIKTLRDESHDDDAGEFLDAIKQDVLRDSIIVYTPKGDPMELPEGSTAIDLAYHIHSEIGEHCMGAKADGAIIPLTRPLKNTQTIQILTAPGAHPHVNWLKHVRSTRARSKIRNWLNRHDADVVIDRNIVARKKPAGDRENKNENATAAVDEASGVGKLETHVQDTTKVGVTIGDERNMMIKISQCCSPSPGDRIIGYISRGRGIIVHKVDCPNLKGIEDFEERRIHVDWETASSKYTQRFRIHSRYTHDLFSEIEGAIRKYRGHLISGSLDETERGDFEGFFTVEMESREDFKKISKSVRAIPTVLSISKVQNFQNRYYG
ncbi:MAG: bifunctional (p)ppGpp synthetase/guanosine-3',5'-bis(diphosphate) 3'-pyrophosphohydrolase, partial [Spirochaetaceae bacterium]|nr:bifunctional (p)ppGpp synthetase/guanosine-3',5'-bis(diphosphate) 3'-pyrophosphohydrolase [Spirochaetaceae bacterium]